MEDTQEDTTGTYKSSGETPSTADGRRRVRDRPRVGDSGDGAEGAGISG